MHSPKRRTVLRKDSSHQQKDPKEEDETDAVNPKRDKGVMLDEIEQELDTGQRRNE